LSAFYTATDHFTLLPAILLALFGCVALFFPKMSGLFSLVLGEVFAGIALWRQLNYLQDSGLSIQAFQGSLVVDGLSLFFNFLFVATGLLCGLISYRYLEVEGEHHGEYYGLMLLAQAGMFFLASGTELVTLFIGLETMAIAFYILVGFIRRDRRSNEAAMKYLLLGAFSTGFLAYGFSLFYGLTGTTKLAGIAQGLAGVESSNALLLLAILTTAVGVFFKIAAAPFHMWTPDAYEGAPTPITAYLSVASKAASFALLLRIFLGPLAAHRDVWEPLLVVVAIASLTIGNFAALTQSNVKRMLAYSSISHVGYILLGLIAGNDTGYRGVLLYTLVYAFMNLGAFLVLVALRRRGGGLGGEHLDDLNGLMRKSPGYAILMVVFLLALAGIPPTAGFWAKYYIFIALIENHQYALAIAGALYTAVSIYYYFRIVKAMFVAEERDAQPLASTAGIYITAAVTGLVTLGFGIFPEPVLRFVTATAGAR